MSSFSEGLGVINQFIGTPYVWGGNDQSGVDCSGFTRAVYEAMGIQLPRVSFQQANGGQAIARGEAQPGDLVWWDLNGRNPGADHVGIYMGNGKVAEASSSKGQVVIRNLWGNAQFTRYGGITDRGAAGAMAGGGATASGTARPSTATPTNPLGTQDSRGAFGTLGMDLSPDDQRTLAELYKRADEDDPGEDESTVGAYNVAKLAMKQQQQKTTPQRFNDDQAKPQSGMLRPTVDAGNRRMF